MKDHFSVHRLVAACAIALAAVAPTLVQAATTTTLVVTPASPVFDGNNVVGVAQDAAPGSPFGSFASNGGNKTDMQFLPATLFGRAVHLGEIASMSYWTKKSTLHNGDPRDWYLTIYTKPYTGDASTPTWYGDRIGTEPYFSGSISETANEWNQWSTDAGDNQLRFFESTAGAAGSTFGSYTDPFWSGFLAAPALSGSTRADKEVLYFSVQTASGWSVGFTGQVDGFRIELTDGSVAKINFEPFVVPTDRDACKKDGWQTLKRANGSTFKNQGDCVSYVNAGK